jgi:hypothetical protein
MSSPKAISELASKLQVLEFYLHNGGSITLLMESTLLSTHNHILDIYNTKTPTTATSSELSWRRLTEYLDSNLMAQHHIERIHETIQRSGIKKEAFCDKAFERCIERAAIVQYTIAIYETLNSRAFDMPSERFPTQDDMNISTMKLNVLRELRNKCAHNYCVPHPDEHYSFYSSERHWEVIHDQLPRLMYWLEKSFCYYVALLPAAFEGEMALWEEKWEYEREMARQKEEERKENEQERAWFTKRGRDEDRKIEATWGNGPCCQEDYCCCNGSNDEHPGEISNNTFDAASEASSHEDWELVSDVTSSENIFVRETDSEYDMDDVNKGISIWDDFIDACKEFTFFLGCDKSESVTEISTVSELSITDSESTNQDLEQVDHSDTSAYNSATDFNIPSPSITTEPRKPTIRYTISDLLAMAPSPEQQLHPLQINPQQLVNGTRFLPLCLPDGQVFWILSTSTVVDTTPEEPFRYQLPQDDNTYDQERTTPNTFGTEYSRETWMNMRKGSSVKIVTGYPFSRRTQHGLK